MRPELRSAICRRHGKLTIQLLAGSTHKGAKADLRSPRNSKDQFRPLSAETI
jgi:hypothetical protein